MVDCDVSGVVIPVTSVTATASKLISTPYKNISHAQGPLLVEGICRREIECGSDVRMYMVDPNIAEKGTYAVLWGCLEKKGDKLY